jgi:hypothetical protein
VRRPSLEARYIAALGLVIYGSRSVRSAERPARSFAAPCLIAIRTWFVWLLAICLVEPRPRTREDARVRMVMHGERPPGVATTCKIRPVPTRQSSRNSPSRNAVDARRGRRWGDPLRPQQVSGATLRSMRHPVSSASSRRQARRQRTTCVDGLITSQSARGGTTPPVRTSRTSRERWGPK